MLDAFVGGILRDSTFSADATENGIAVDYEQEEGGYGYQLFWNCDNEDSALLDAIQSPYLTRKNGPHTTPLRLTPVVVTCWCISVLGGTQPGLWPVINLRPNF